MASRRLFDGAQIEIGSLPIVGAAAATAYTLIADGGVYSYSNDNFLATETEDLLLTEDDRQILLEDIFRYSRTLTVGGVLYNYFGNNATLTFAGGPPPVVEVIGVGGPQVTNIFLFNGVTEPPFPVQRRTS